MSNCALAVLRSSWLSSIEPTVLCSSLKTASRTSLLYPESNPSPSPAPAPVRLLLDTNRPSLPKLSPKLLPNSLLLPNQAYAKPLLEERRANGVARHASGLRLGLRLKLRSSLRGQVVL